MDLEAMKAAMASVKQEEVVHDARPFFVIYKDGSVHRFMGTLSVPPSVDGLTGVESKDVVICKETGVYVRLYKPPNVKSGEKVPILVYFHGGGFVIESASSPVYHAHLNALCCKGNLVVVSVNYRLAPEHPLPIGYEDSWAAVEWVGKVAGGGCEEGVWVKEYGDVERVFMAGDSAGANIAHHMAKRLKKNPVGKLALKGLVLVHPFFWGKDHIGSELQKMSVSGMGPPGNLAERLWLLVHPKTSGLDDPLINPAKDPELGELGGGKVMVFVAEQDALRDRGVMYKEVLLKSGWKGAADVVETDGENHVFHLMNPASPKAADLMDKIVAFLNSS